MTAAEIPIPESKPRRDRENYPTDGPRFITLDEAETLALATGQHRGMTCHFSDDGTAWVEAWVPSEAHPHHPEFAKAVVTRKYDDGDLVETPSVIRWDEYVPDITSDRYEDWMRSPTVYIGKCAKVSSYRGGFRDVIGNRYAREELHHVPEVAA